MKTKRYELKGSSLSGITLRDTHAREDNNQALHACLYPTDILQNREALATELSYTMDDFVFANQTHSNHFKNVTQKDRGRGVRTQATAIPDTDALYTKERGLILAVFTADCVPVLLANEEAGVIAAVHSGWQGTVKEITPTLLQHLIQKEQCRPEAFEVVIGPTLSQEKFEVDRDVYEQFHALGYADPWIKFNNSTGKYHIDNQQVVKAQCERAGIPSAQITIDPMCTFESDDGFSYRQDQLAGRHLAFISKK